MHHNKHLKVKPPPILFQTKIVRVQTKDGKIKEIPMNRAQRRKAGIR